MKWKTLPSRGNTTPGPLWGHTCTAMKSSLHLYVFGGCGSDGHRTNRLHILYPVIILWREPLTSGRPPTPRNNHRCTVVGDYLFIFGGTDGIKTFNDYYILDTRTLSWNQPIVGGTKPEPREGHSAAYVDHSESYLVDVANVGTVLSTMMIFTYWMPISPYGGVLKQQPLLQVRE